MRTPITLKIKFKSSSLDQFIERYSVDVSRGGIFIRTKEPLPVGTTLRFEFQLQDGSSLIGGEGTVVWNRAYDPSRTGVAPGMGVRFDKLTHDSQRVLERILSEKHKRGEAQLESRFDAGVRASREARSHEFPDAGTPLPTPVPGMGMSSSPGLSGPPGGARPDGFGDEPTRMMAAEQMNALAAEMQSAEDFAQDQPTRRATLDEIRRAVSAVEPAMAPARTGSTGEQVRLRAGGAAGTPPRAPSSASGASAASNASKMTSAMGVVIPGVAAGTQPTSSSQDFPLPESLATRPVTDAEAAALVAASNSMRTPDAQGRAAPPPAPAPKERSGAEELAAQAATVVDLPTVNLPTAPAPAPAPSPAQAVLQTISTPPPAEAADFLDESHAHTMPSGPAPEGAPSGISIGLDFDSMSDATAPAAPLDPAAFAPVSSSPPPQREPKGASPPSASSKEPPKAEPPMTEQATGKVKATTAPISPPGGQKSGGARTAVLIVALLGGVALAGAGIYALLSNPTPQPPPGPPTAQPPPRVQPAPPRVQPAPPAPAAPEKGPEQAGTDKGQKAGPQGEPDKGPARPATAQPAGQPAGQPGAQPEKAGPPGEAKKPGPGEKQAEKQTMISITSEPPGARVELNGKAVGETPLQTPDVQAGKTYDVKLSLRGYQDLKFKVKAAQGENVEKVAKLTPYERVVEVNSTPRGADVLLDGKRVGRTPYTLKRLDLSKIHEIEVRKPGYAPQTAKVADTDTFELKGAREVRTLNLTLEAQPGAPAPKAEPAQPKPATKAEPAQPKPATKRPAPKDSEAPKADPPAPEGAEAPKGEPAKADPPKTEPAKADPPKAEEGEQK